MMSAEEVDRRLAVVADQLRRHKAKSAILIEKMERLCNEGEWLIAEGDRLAANGEWLIAEVKRLLNEGYEMTSPNEDDSSSCLPDTTKE